jgi:hypothetical protein
MTKTAVKPKPKSDQIADFQLKETLQRDYKEDLQSHDDYISEFDAYEAMVMSKTYDSVSKKTKSGITDGSTTTIYLERAARVVGQLPEGVVRATGKRDKGKAVLMDIIRQKWVYPNANSQHPFLTKVRMWQFYSSVYGFMPMFYDWNVSPSGYIGPDCWLWNPRNWIPQAGKTSIADMDYCHSISYISPRFLESLLDEPEEAGWDKEAIRQILEEVKESTREQDTERDTYISRSRTKQSVRQIPLATRYEAGDDGKWVTFAPDHGFLTLRNIDNPHKNGKIPFIIKFATPLFDSIYGLGDFQRSKPIQFAKDGATNFYFEGLKTNLFPPWVMNPNGVIKHTVDQRAGVIIEETIPNSIRRLETSTAGLSTYQAVSTMLSGALLNLAGTTDTTMNAENSLNPGFGRTPQALRMTNARESTRDEQDRFYLEQALNELIECMMGLIPTVGTEHIPIDLFADDIKEIVDAGYTDVLELFEEEDEQGVISRYARGKNTEASVFEVNESGESARLTVNPAALQGLYYRFEMEWGSTAKATKQEQLQSLLDALDVLGKFQNVFQDALQGQFTLELDKLTKMIESLGDVPGFSEIVKKNPMAAQAVGQAGPSPLSPPRFRDPAVATAHQEIAEAAAQIGVPLGGV